MGDCLAFDGLLSDVDDVELCQKHLPFGYLPNQDGPFKDILEWIHSSNQIHRITEQVVTESCGSPSEGATGSFQQGVSGFAFSEPFDQIVDGMLLLSSFVVLPQYISH